MMLSSNTVLDAQGDETRQDKTKKCVVNIKDVRNIDRISYISYIIRISYFSM